MTSYEIFKILHIIGALFLFIGLGGLLGIGENRTHINKLVSIFNGIGLLLLIIAGFGIQGVMKMGFPVWMILKLVLWFGFVAVFVMAKKDKLPARTAVIISLLMGAVVVWLCIDKPFVAG